MRLFLAILLTLASLNSAKAGEWFLHEFGELRSYHGDFLAVCQNAGDGPCRAVQHLWGPGDDKPFFGIARLGVHRINTGDYAVELFARVLPDDPVGPFSLTIDGRAQDVSPDAFSLTSPEGYAVAETVSLHAGPETSAIVAGMKRGFFLTFTYPEGRDVYSLRGLTAALNAIEKLKRESH